MDLEVRQTHISVVFLAGPYAYKVKKPVDLRFLDFTTLEKRLRVAFEWTIDLFFHREVVVTDPMREPEREPAPQEVEA